MLYQSTYTDNYNAEGYKYNSRRTVKGFGADLICDYSTDTGENQSEQYAEYQHKKIRGFAVNNKMTYRTCKCCKGHNEYACANSGFKLIAKHHSKYHQHHHSAACTYKTADKAYKQTENN